MNRLATLASVGALALSTACGDALTGLGASTRVAGSYQMQSIDGSRLPYTFTQGSRSSTLMSDVIVIADGGTWSETGVVQSNESGRTLQQTFAYSGTWSYTGNTLVLTSGTTGQTMYSGTLTGSNQLSLSDGIYNYVFVR